MHLLFHRTLGTHATQYPPSENQYLLYTNYMRCTKYVLLPTEQIDTCRYIIIFQEKNDVPRRIVM
jgi:hypothetical protein